MKIIRKHQAAGGELVRPRMQPWKVLVVDDEPDVRRLTAMNLRGFEFGGRGLELLEAASFQQAQQVLAAHADVAVALIDVVMETDDAGLRLVEHIRQVLGNAMMRLVILTGQPGLAPERHVIEHYDIDDYKDKTELTVQRLCTTVRNSIKGYRDLQTIELNRRGLARILEVTPDLYDLHRDRLEDYFKGVLTQLIALCNLGHSGFISTIDGLVMTVEGQDVCIRAGVGDFDDSPVAEQRRHEVMAMCTRVVEGHDPPQGLRDGAVVVPLQVRSQVLGFVYLESAVELSKADHELIQIMANQCAAALDNFRLHHSLESAYDEAIDMLGQVAEFKDSATGTHIRRIQAYTLRLATAMGLSERESRAFAKASRLHDVGKVGIPDHILRKAGKLDEQELQVMQRHVLIGDAILRRSPSLALARVVARSHHERWDGSGYPDGLSGTAIPLAARLVAVVDVFDALMSARPYKAAWVRQQALDEVRAGAGRMFDPVVAKAFLDLVEAGALDDLIALSLAPPEPLLSRDSGFNQDPGG